MISGLSYPQNGNIILDGVDIKNINPQKRSIGFMFQDYALFPHLTALENILFPLDRKIIRKSTMKPVNDFLKRMGIESLSNSYPTNLSGGEKQRVALIRSIINNPSCLLLDEPFSALDAYVRGEIVSYTKEILQEMKIPTLMVTHDVKELYHFADQVVILNTEGKIDQMGTVSEIYENPATLLAGKIVGQMNCIPAHKSKSDLLSVLNITLSDYKDRSSGKGEGLVCFRPGKTVLNKNPTNENSVQCKIKSVIKIDAIDHCRIKVEKLTLDAISPENSEFKNGDTAYFNIIDPIFF